MSPHSLMAAIAVLQARLQHDRQQLAGGMPTALHGLRVNLRQLRSLLKPLDELDVFAELSASAQALAGRSGAARDLEVLLAELAAWGSPLAGQKQQQLGQLQADLAGSTELAEFFSVLANFTSLVSWHDLPDEAAIRQRLRKAEQRWKKQIVLTLATMRTTPDDTAASSSGRVLSRHELRLLIKRLRYTLTWQGADQQKMLMRALKQAQARIGEWHDRCNWISAAETDAGLADFAAIWRGELVFHADSADASLQRLGMLLQAKHSD